ncbi:MAG: hypothetical protein ACRD8A_08660 [Candidatus Acidiferrales bacterium]
MVINWWSRYLAALVLGLSALVVLTLGALSHLSAIVVTAVAAVLVFAGFLSTKQSLPDKNPAKQWLLLAVGVMFLAEVSGSFNRYSSIGTGLTACPW